MKSRKLFDGITNIREDIIEKAENYDFNTSKQSIKNTLIKWGTLAACFCLLFVIISGSIIMTKTPSLPNNSNGGSDLNGVSGGNTGISYMHYEGPVFPMSALTDMTGISVERNVNYDFSPYETVTKYHESNGERFEYEACEYESIITDSYLLTNTTTEAITTELVYAFVGSLSQEYKYMPAIYVEDTQIETKLHPGKISGKFYSAQGKDPIYTDRYNIGELNSWTDFQTLLSNGEYMQNALSEDYPALNQKVIVYKLSNMAYTGDDKKAVNPTLNLEFHMDTSKTTLLTYLFNGSSDNAETGEYQRSTSVPLKGDRLWDDRSFLIVLGEDISNLSMHGYRNGGCNAYDEIEGITADMERYETTLADVLREILIDKDYGGPDTPVAIEDTISFDTKLGCLADLLYDYGLLSENPAERYQTGRLFDMWQELAKLCGISAAKLSQKLFKLRKELKKHLEKEEIIL